MEQWECINEKSLYNSFYEKIYTYETHNKWQIRQQKKAEKSKRYLETKDKII